MATELLSAIEVRNAKPGDKARKLRDGNGLNLLVHPNGSKCFQLRYTLHGKEKTLQLGVYPTMGLAEARVAAKAARQLVVSGIDRVQNKRIKSARKLASAANTFRSVAEQWLASSNTPWRHPLIKRSKKRLAPTYTRDLATFRLQK
jgi:hypothetical protein